MKEHPAKVKANNIVYHQPDDCRAERFNQFPE